jgi:hypothetical protein
MPARAATLARLAPNPTDEQGRLVLKDYQTQRPPVKRHQHGDQAGRTVTPFSRQPRIANCERRTDQFAANQPTRSIVTTAMALAADEKRLHHHAACRFADRS